jgi:hypothetical protein
MPVPLTARCIGRLLVGIIAAGDNRGRVSVSSCSLRRSRASLDGYAYPESSTGINVRLRLPDWR